MVQCAQVVCRRFCLQTYQQYCTVHFVVMVISDGTWILDCRGAKETREKKLLWVVLNRVRMYHKLMSGMLGSVWGPLLGSRGVVLVGSRVQSPLRLWGTILVSAVSLGEKFNLGIGYIFVQSALLHLKIPNNSNSGIPLSWQDGKLG